MSARSYNDTDTATLALIVAVDRLLGPLSDALGSAMIPERLAAHDAARAAEAAVRERERLVDRALAGLRG